MRGIRIESLCELNVDSVTVWIVLTYTLHCSQQSDTHTSHRLGIIQGHKNGIHVQSLKWDQCQAGIIHSEQAELQ